MENRVCDELLQYQPTNTKNENLKSWYIVNSVFNAFLAITAIILNSVTIQALRKSSSLPKHPKTLFLSLAVSDLGVGLLVEPLYFGLLVKWLLQRDNSSLCTAILAISYFFATASFFGVMALSGDRFLAVHLHLRYQELVTSKRVVALVISIWVFSAFMSVFRLSVSPNIFYIGSAFTLVVGLLLSAMLYFKIYFAVRHHKHQIQALQVAQNDQIGAARLRKSAVGTFYVYLVFLLCYLPQVCSFTVLLIFGLSTGVKVFVISSYTLLLLNSSLNPVIYCWKMRQIRRAVRDIVRNIFQSHN
ncbi:histamine H2 receptor-like [Orbicella faveolata]|uniref:histamine H2 receptor-like n=1 Tax=Orbicella faveolata TaxID=48498 RepID=UPI0009E2FC7D|nr:histamine H2 receptor-like [Orbicella faveolata]